MSPRGIEIQTNKTFERECITTPQRFHNCVFIECGVVLNYMEPIEFYDCHLRDCTLVSEEGDKGVFLATHFKNCDFLGTGWPKARGILP